MYHKYSVRFKLRNHLYQFFCNRIVKYIIYNISSDPHIIIESHALIIST